MISFKQFFTKNTYYKVKEAFATKPVYKKSKSFGDLPHYVPYGFIVWKDGSFTVISDWGGHYDARVHMNRIDPLVPVDEKRFFEAGNIRMSHDSGGVVKKGVYYCDYEDSRTSNAAKKTMKDLAAFYNQDCEEDSQIMKLLT